MRGGCLPASMLTSTLLIHGLGRNSTNSPSSQPLFAKDSFCSSGCKQNRDFVRAQGASSRRPRQRLSMTFQNASYALTSQSDPRCWSLWWRMPSHPVPWKRRSQLPLPLHDPVGVSEHYGSKKEIEFHSCSRNVSEPQLGRVQKAVEVFVLHSVLIQHCQQPQTAMNIRRLWSQEVQWPPSIGLWTSCDQRSLGTRHVQLFVRSPYFVAIWCNLFITIEKRWVFASACMVMWWDAVMHKRPLIACLLQVFCVWWGRAFLEPFCIFLSTAVDSDEV